MSASQTPTPDDLSGFYKENKKLANEYIETRLEIFRLNSIKLLSRTLSILLLIFIASFMVLFFLLFLVISFSWFMADQLGSAALGFLCGGGMFLIILIFCIVFRKPFFVNPFIRLFLKASLQETHNDEED